MTIKHIALNLSPQNVLRLDSVSGQFLATSIVKGLGETVVVFVGIYLF